MRDSRARTAAATETDRARAGEPQAEQLPLHDQEARCDSLTECSRKLLRFGRKHKKHLPGL